MNFQQPDSSAQMRMPDAVNNGMQNIGDSLGQMQSSVNDTLNQFSQKAESGTNASFEFLQSNTIIAKFAFLILVLICFLIFINLGIMLIGYFTSPSKDPYLIRGMADGNNAKIVTQDPTSDDSIPIARSNNATTGAEFTWSSWLFINDLGNDNNKYQHIFNKGDGNYSSANNITSVNNAPGLYLHPNSNSLHVIIDTVNPNDPNTIVDISNVPIKKWFHVALRLKNNIFDVYINGTISNRLLLQNVVKQNYNNVYISQNGGFNGKISNLRYYSYALNVFELNSIVYNGPNLTVTDKILGQSDFTYLSSMWYSR